MSDATIGYGHNTATKHAQDSNERQPSSGRPKKIDRKKPVRLAIMLTQKGSDRVDQILFETKIITKAELVRQSSNAMLALHAKLNIEGGNLLIRKSDGTLENADHFIEKLLTDCAKSIEANPKVGRPNQVADDEKFNIELQLSLKDDAYDTLIKLKQQLGLKTAASAVRISLCLYDHLIDLEQANNQLLIRDFNTGILEAISRITK